MAEKPKDWLVVQPSLDPILAVPNAVIGTLDSVLSFMITILNITNVILNVVKVFLVGLLNPIRAIVEAIVEEIRAWFHDLRQLGIYLTGDWNLIEVKPVNRTEELLGGYEAYERRMLKRLLNRKDPGRPDFTSRSACIALFTYRSSGDVVTLIELINRIKAFFGAGGETKGAPYAAPTVPEAEFQTATSILRQPLPNLGGPPTKVVLTWAMPGTGSLFSDPPAGFLVHVSTVPNGFGVRTMMFDARGEADDVVAPGYQPSVGIDATTGSELRLFGGVSDLSTEFSDFSDVARDSLQANKLLLSLDQNTPLIPPGELLVDGGVPLGGATYFVKVSGFSKAVPGQSYSATLNYEDLPQAIAVEADGSGGVTVSGEDCYTFYARARPVTKTYADALGDVKEGTSRAPALVGGETLKLNHWSNKQITANSSALFLPTPGAPGPTPSSEVTAGEVGPASAPAVFSMPTAAAMDLVTATIVALEILLLVRVDLTEVTAAMGGFAYGAKNTYEPGAATGLEAFRDQMTSMEVDLSVFYEQTDSKKFRRRVRRLCRQSATRKFLQAPSESIAATVAEQVRTLLDFKWSDIDSRWPDYSILETMSNQSGTWGVAANPMGAGLTEMSGRLRRGATVGGEDLWLSREGLFPPKVFSSGTTTPEALARAGLPPTGWYQGQGYSDYCPVLFSTLDEASTALRPLYMQFVRRLLIDYDGGSMLQAASVVLGIVAAPDAPSPSETEWLSVRFLDDALAPLDALLVDVEKYLLAILDGLKGTIDKIVAYIEAIQARIFQVQALIEMIRALLNSLSMFSLPSFSGLLLVENGTDGITRGLITAGNKPSDSALSYGGGVLVMAGGLPVILLEILELILGAEGGE